MGNHVEINKEELIGALKAISEKIEENKEYLSKLDTEIGDGDHGFSMANGFSSMAEKLQEYPGLSIGEILKKSGFELIKKIGGAAGAVFGTLFTAQASYYQKNLNEKDTLSLQDMVSMLEEAADQIQKRGGAKPGDKTMIDALLPAVEVLKKAAKDNKTFSEAFKLAAEEARRGAESTRNMIARKGRSKNLGERSVGYIDPGAESTHLIFKALAEFFEKIGK